MGYQIQAVFDLSQTVPLQELQVLANHMFPKNYLLVDGGVEGNRLRVVRPKVLNEMVLILFVQNNLQTRKSIDYFF